VRSKGLAILSPRSPAALGRTSCRPDSFIFAALPPRPSDLCFFLSSWLASFFVRFLVCYGCTLCREHVRYDKVNRLDDVKTDLEYALSLPDFQPLVPVSCLLPLYQFRLSVLRLATSFDSFPFLARPVPSPCCNSLAGVLAGLSPATLRSLPRRQKRPRARQVTGY